MSDLDLFGESGGGEGGAAAVDAPLAARMRPRSLEEFVGQTQLLDSGRALREMIEKDQLSSLIFWGPPGTGKTTLARIIADRTSSTFVPFSAVTEGVARVREIIAQAAVRLRSNGRRTILFCDEIHRFNKAQQDAFLPHVEAGTVVLIGATTENPSFEVIGALLSRARVFVLAPLSDSDIESVLSRALSDAERGLGGREIEVAPDTLRQMAGFADGDARRGLNILEAAAALAGDGGTIDAPLVREAVQHRFAHHDKGGEAHFNLLSAYHKSLRGSDADAALYWMARWIEGGGDPRLLLRRAIAMAAEDIGLADPNALQLAVAARQAFDVLGPPEGYLPLAEATIYLATAPKSNAGYRALRAALDAAQKTPAAPVPLHIRNAPTGLMKELGYGAGYRYAHDTPQAWAPQEYLPDEVRDREYYVPGDFGFEKRIAERMAWWRKLREDDAGVPSSGRDAEGVAEGTVPEEGE